MADQLGLDPPQDLRELPDVRPGADPLGSLGDAETDRRVIADALAAMQERKSYVVEYGGSNGAGPGEAGLGVFLEVVEPQPTLIVVGAGHIAVPLARLGKMLAFEVIIPTRFSWDSGRGPYRAERCSSTRLM